MSVRADLHIHTTASDGTWTPAELITEAQKQQLGLIAVLIALNIPWGSFGHYGTARSRNLLHQGGFVLSYPWLRH